MCSVYHLRPPNALTHKRIYYQGNPKRLPVCTLPIHTLLHLADCIEGWGPVWCYWSYPMERFCGHLKKGAKSGRFPYNSLDHYLIEWTIVWHLGAIHNIRDVLKLERKKRESSGKSKNRLEIPGCEYQKPASLSFAYAAVQTTDVSSRRGGLCQCPPPRTSSCL